MVKNNNGLFNTMRTMIFGVKAEWYSSYRLAKRAFATKYKRSRFGLVWEFLDPLAIAVIFATMYHFRGISVMNTGIPYTVFIVTGVMLWYSFQDGLNTAIKTFTSQKQLLGATSVNAELLILSNIYLVCFSTFLRFVIAIATSIFFMNIQFIGIFNYFVITIIIMMLGLGIGFLLAPFATINSDVASVTGMIVRPLMFISSVIFPLPISANVFFEWMRHLNPMAILIENARALLIDHSLIDHISTFSIFILFCLFIFCLGWYVVHVTLLVVGDQN